MDLFEGNNLDPLSLHKYVYSSASPVDRADPSGNDDLAEVSAAQGIGEELDTQVSPAQALGPRPKQRSQISILFSE